MSPPPGRVLVLGGARSGKSRFAEGLVAEATAVRYVATAPDRPGDDEWAERVRRHQERRPASWRTVETGDLAAALRDAGAEWVLVDSITAWLARAMDETDGWNDADPAARITPCCDELVSAWSASRSAVAVSDEVGGGVVPESRSGRVFRDLLGELNQRLAAAADEVHLVVAGLPLRLR